eukprot:GCRY01003550.1.p1 GENE.GCRY01003550.1~~GCRY01003550.1.p1  ORF type:complete len:538 (-),score=119.62 GCRY01003550.1:90-1703(-)
MAEGKGLNRKPAPKNADTQRSKGGEKQKDVRQSCIIAAKAVADAIRTSLGPKGMDKMIVSPSKEVTITNDGATILEKMNVIHPAAKMFVELSKAQDVEAGDGTTSVVVIAGALLNAALQLLENGLHPRVISDAFGLAVSKGREVLEEMSIPLILSDRESLLNSAITSLNSKVVSQHSAKIAPLAVDAVMSVIDPKTATTVELKDIKVVKKVGGTIDDTELVDGLVFAQHASHKAGGPSRIENAKVALLQFCLSAPKTDVDSSVVVSDYTQMDRIIREERKYILGLCRKVQKTGANVVLIQKSILRDAVSELALHFLAKMNIMVIRDIERDDIEFICKGLGCLPIASQDSLTSDKLGKANLVEEFSTPGGKIVKMTGIPNAGRVVSVLCRASNKLILEEVERSIHDALCVIRSIVKKKFLICGGSAPEMEVSYQLQNYAKTLIGMESVCVRAYAEALEVVPYTLAENAGLNAIKIVTELRSMHAAGSKGAGVNVRKSCVTDMQEEKVVQPLLVSLSALTLATETVQMILKIDDIVAVR